MVGLTSLWLPILLSAVIVFVASALIHMVLGYHWGDWRKVPGEDGVREAIRKAGVGPGNYLIPHPGTPKKMQTPEMIEKCKEGPVAFLFVQPSGAPSMGKNLLQWFIYTLVAGIFTAYVAGRTLGPGADYLDVFRIAGTVAFLIYAGAEPLSSIWKGVRWSTTLKFLMDGLIYGLLTGGVFGWLWP